MFRKIMIIGAAAAAIAASPAYALLIDNAQVANKLASNKLASNKLAANAVSSQGNLNGRVVAIEF